jgi:hypothetical protein
VGREEESVSRIEVGARWSHIALEVEKRDHEASLDDLRLRLSLGCGFGLLAWN